MPAKSIRKTVKKTGVKRSVKKTIIKKPKVVLIGGLMGAGKTTICKRLEASGYKIRDIDDFSIPWLRMLHKKQGNVDVSKTFKSWVQQKIDKEVKSKKQKPLVFCVLSSFYVHLRGKRPIKKYMNIKFPKETDVYWLNVNEKEALKRVQQRAGRNFAPEEIRHVKRSLKIIKAGFKKVHKGTKSKTADQLHKILVKK
jgi:adenylate kinase family enzyme